MGPRGVFRIYCRWQLEVHVGCNILARTTGREITSREATLSFNQHRIQFSHRHVRTFWWYEKDSLARCTRTNIEVGKWYSGDLHGFPYWSVLFRTETAKVGNRTRMILVLNTRVLQPGGIPLALVMKNEQSAAASRQEGNDCASSPGKTNVRQSSDCAVDLGLPYCSINPCSIWKAWSEKNCEGKAVGTVELPSNQKQALETSRESHRIFLSPLISFCKKKTSVTDLFE